MEEKPLSLKKDMFVDEDRSEKLASSVRQKITSKTKSRLTCKCCGYQTNYTDSLESHYKSTHPNVAYRMIKTLKLTESKRKRKSKTIYRCEECSYETKIRQRILVHEDVHKDLRDRQSYICDICKFTYVTKQSLKNHLLTKHTVLPQSIQCNKCTFATASKYDLADHMKVHEQKKNKETVNYKCQECTFESETLHGLRIHEAVHKDRSRDGLSVSKRELGGHKNIYKILRARKPFICNTCNFEYKSKQSLKTHIFSKHTLPQCLQCNKCEFTAISKGELRDHRKVHEQKTSKEAVKYICQECTFETESHDDLRIHEATHKDSLRDGLIRTLQYKCQKCMFTSESIKGLRIHEVSHRNHLGQGHTDSKCDLDHMKVVQEHKTSKEGVKYKCQECTFETGSLGGLRIHEDTHKKCSDKKLFACTVCNAKYSIKGTLIRHIIQTKHLPPNGLPELQCDICEFTTTSKTELRAHSISKHSADNSGISNSHLAGVSKMEHKCATCSSEYPTKEALTEHMLVHRVASRSSKRYVCNCCEFKTTDESEMKSHIVIHKSKYKSPRDFLKKQQNDKPSNSGEPKKEVEIEQVWIKEERDDALLLLEERKAAQEMGNFTS